MLKKIIVNFLFLFAGINITHQAFALSNAEKINQLVMSLEKVHTNTKQYIGAAALHVLEIIYDSPESECNSKPGYDCNGFFLTAFEQPNDYWLQPNLDTDRMSYTFMLKNTATNPYSNAGLILIPTSLRNKFPKSVYPQLHCAFPVDGGTFMREDHGCGQMPGSTNSKPCQEQGIFTADDWFKIFNVNETAIGFISCGFAFTGDADNDAKSYSAIHDIIVKSDIRNTYMSWNEYVFHSWPQYSPSTVPVLAFFYMPDYTLPSVVKHNIDRKEIKGAFSLSGNPRVLAIQEQLLFYKASNLYAPVIRISGKFPDVTFSVLDEDQSSDIPNNNLIWGPQ